MKVLNRNQTLKLLKSNRRKYLSMKSGNIHYRSWNYLIGQNPTKKVKLLNYFIKL